MFCTRIVKSDSGRVLLMRHNQQGSNMVAPNEGYQHARPHVPKFSEVYFTFGKHRDRHGEHHSRPKSWGLNQGPQGPNLVVERIYLFIFCVHNHVRSNNMRTSWNPYFVCWALLSWLNWEKQIALTNELMGQQTSSFNVCVGYMYWRTALLWFSHNYIACLLLQVPIRLSSYHFGIL